MLIKNGRILDPSQNLDQEGDLLIENGKISAIETPGKISSQSEIIDAKGMWVLPGFIDAHVHLRIPGQEHKEDLKTGTAAAVAGGFTSVACMANTDPVNDSPYITSFIREKAKETALCRVFPIGAISKGLKGEELAEIGGMVREGARAISDDGLPVMNSELMRRAMEYAKTFDIPVVSHAEDKNLVAGGVMNEGETSTKLGLKGNPSAAEEIMVAREIALCRLTGCRTHIAHVSTRLAVDHIRRAKEEGLPLTAEVCPHHLVLTDESVMGYDTHCKMAPPLRTEKDIKALQDALAKGVIDMVATDHAPHSQSEKECEFDQAVFGITGLETAMALTLKFVHEDRLSLTRWIQSLTTAPATLLGLDLGTLKKNKDADICILDPDHIWKFESGDIFSKSQNTPFLGRELKGKIRYTIVGGKIAYKG